MKMGRWWILLVVFLVCGCAPWKPVKEGRVNGEGNLSVELPAGWMQATAPGVEGIMITRDGLALQFVQVQWQSHQEVFADLSKETSSEILPSELADLTVAHLKTKEGLENLVVVENRPENIGGLQGFRIHLRFKNPKGLRYDRIVCGVANEKGIYFLTYQAALLYYFDKDLNAFEEMVSSFQAGSS